MSKIKEITVEMSGQELIDRLQSDSPPYGAISADLYDPRFEVDSVYQNRETGLWRFTFRPKTEDSPSV